jgi:hypothetical protein
MCGRPEVTRSLCCPEQMADDLGFSDEQLFGLGDCRGTTLRLRKGAAVPTTPGRPCPTPELSSKGIKA